MPDLEKAFPNLNSSTKEAFLGALASKIGDDRTQQNGLIDKLIGLGFARFDILHLAIVLKERGYRKKAAQLLTDNISQFGPNSSDLYELSVLSLVENHLAGIEQLKESVSMDGNFENVRLCILLSFFLRNTPLRAYAVQKARPGIVDRVFSECHQLIRYLSTIEQHLPAEDDGIFEVNELRIDETDTWFPILSAGGSLLRLGDGEGAMFRFDDEEELLLYDIYGSNRSHFHNRWFGSKQDNNEYDIYQSNLRGGLSDFNLIGVPNASWLMKCLSSGDILGFSCAWNVIRAIRQNECVNTSRFVRTSAFYDFLYRKKTSEIIQHDTSVALVSWNDTIPVVLALEGYKGVVDFIGVNPSASDVARISDRDFRAKTSQLELIHSAAANILSDGQRTVLLAAGFVAKVASISWRRSGHRVVDVGSAFDMSMGLPIR